MSSRSEYFEYTEDKDIQALAENEAARFVREEVQFQLGHLPTEQPHPYTMNFSSEVKDLPSKGVARLLQVDADLPPVARRTFLTKAYSNLVEAMKIAVRDERRICFSGCGSTGRLALLLEEMWRQYWEERAGVEPGAAEKRHSMDTNLKKGNLACSIMSGGDRALIRAVENFEDYLSFGARQVVDLELSKGDILVAITEGGETSSVIGTAEEAQQRGCQVFLLFNNPAAILCESVERSRRVIEHPDITVIDLFSGSMSLTGSTRMQATTLEMLIVGAAMEEAFLYAERKEKTISFRLAQANRFAILISQLGSKQNLKVMGDLAAKEADLYSIGGRVTYLASRFLLDIFSDTTERSPTFMLPPIRKGDDTAAPVSWAIAKDPSRPSEEAWFAMLRHTPRGIGWTEKDYTEMGAPVSMTQDPPALGKTEISRYIIGNEKETSIIERQPNWFLQLRVGYIDSHISRGIDTLWIGSSKEISDSAEYQLQVALQQSPILLWHHLAVKLVANTVSTASMGIMGRIRENWMVQLDPTNKKLVDRGSRIIAQLTGLEYSVACEQLHVSMYAREAFRNGGGNTTTSPVVDALNRLGISEY